MGWNPALCGYRRTKFIPIYLICTPLNGSFWLCDKRLRRLRKLFQYGCSTSLLVWDSQVTTNSVGWVAMAEPLIFLSTIQGVLQAFLWTDAEMPSAFLQQQCISIRHWPMLQYNNGDPSILESLRRACPCAAYLSLSSFPRFCLRSRIYFLAFVLECRKQFSEFFHGQARKR